jgi:hypothetical protein
MKKNTLKKTSHITALLLLAAAVLFLIIFMHIHIDRILNADDSSELVLAKLLSENKEILSGDWYYSTELRVLNTQLIYTPFFWIFKSWHMVRVCSLAVMYCILIAGARYLSSKSSIKRYFPVIALLLVLPVSYDYLRFVLKGAYYVPHIAVNLFEMGMLFRYIKAENGKDKRTVLIISVILSVFAGAGGARQIVILYLPLLLGVVMSIAANLYNKRYAEVTDPFIGDLAGFSLASFLGAAIGFVINAKVLSRFFTFKQWDSINFTKFSAENFFDVLNGFWAEMGYREGTVGLGTLLTNGIAIVLFALALWSMLYGIRNYRRVSREYHVLAVFYASFLVVFTALYVWTDMLYRDRYNIPSHIFGFVLILFWIRESRPRFNIRSFLLLLYIGALLINSVSAYRFFGKADSTSEYREIVSYLTSEGYEYGYGTFWNTSILTELSDGRMKMHTWTDSKNSGTLEDLTDVDYTYKWLQAKENDTLIPEGKVFVIFAANEPERLVWKENIGKLTPIYTTHDFIIFGFKDHDEMKSLIENGQADRNISK